MNRGIPCASCSNWFAILHPKVHLTLRVSWRRATVVVSMGCLTQLVCAVGLFHHAVGWAPVAPMRAVRPAIPMRRAVPLLSTLSDGGRGDREPRLKAALSQMQGRLKQARKRPPPDWVRRAAKKTAAILFRMRGVLPAILVALLLLLRAASGGPPRPVELPFSAFMSMAADQAMASRLTSVKISVSRIAFMLDGSPAFVRTPRASSSKHVLTKVL